MQEEANCGSAIAAPSPRSGRAVSSEPLNGRVALKQLMIEPGSHIGHVGRGNGASCAFDGLLASPRSDGREVVEEADAHLIMPSVSQHAALEDQNTAASWRTLSELELLRTAAEEMRRSILMPESTEPTGRRQSLQPVVPPIVHDGIQVGPFGSPAPKVVLIISSWGCLRLVYEDDKQQHSCHQGHGQIDVLTASHCMVCAVVRCRQLVGSSEELSHSTLLWPHTETRHRMAAQLWPVERGIHHVPGLPCLTITLSRLQSPCP